MSGKTYHVSIERPGKYVKVQAIMTLIFGLLIATVLLGITMWLWYENNDSQFQDIVGTVTNVIPYTYQNKKNVTKNAFRVTVSYLYNKRRYSTVIPSKKLYNVRDSINLSVEKQDPENCNIQRINHNLFMSMFLSVAIILICTCTANCYVMHHSEIVVAHDGSYAVKHIP